MCLGFAAATAGRALEGGRTKKTGTAHGTGYEPQMDGWLVWIAGHSG